MSPLLRSLLLSLFLLATPLVAHAQLVIAGRVTGDGAAPLAGAQVLIQGTTIGTIAAENGGYRLVIASPRPGMILLVRSLGYKPARQTLTQKTGSARQDVRLWVDPRR